MAKLNLNFNLSVVVLRERKRYIAYAPALDLSTSGETFDQARKRFVEIASIFFQELIAKGTLNDVLQELGWQKTNKKWLPPLVISQTPQSISIPVPA